MVNRDVITIVLGRAKEHKMTTAVRIAVFVSEWGLAEAEAGHAIGAEDFAAWPQAPSRRTVYRRLAEFRELFPEFDTPAGMAPQKLPQPGGQAVTT